MLTVEESTMVGEVVTRAPGLARVFERFGIDYCCGGRRSLADACREKGLDVDSVLRAVADEQSATEDRTGRTNWADAPLVSLIAHIVDTHHVYLRRELPLLSGMIDRVVAAHGARHGELGELREVFIGLRTELEEHMLKEEHILFPMICRMDAAASMPEFHCGSVNNPIHVMEQEHDDAGRALARLRLLTGDYAPPADACATYRVLLAGLAELEADVHEHIHEENNILFPRAAALEARLRASA